MPAEEPDTVTDPQEDEDEHVKQTKQQSGAK